MGILSLEMVGFLRIRTRQTRIIPSQISAIKEISKLSKAEPLF